ncbi:MAG: hypothetical protein PSY14_01485 [bacterium]|nr:hypothetical protein [bacterium]
MNGESIKFHIVLIAFAVASFLSGCSAANITLQREISLAKATKSEATRDCSAYGDIATGEPRGRKNALKLHSCVSKVVDRTLLPKSAFPDIWLSGRAKGRRLAKAYYDGSIDYDEFKSRSDELSSEGLRAINTRLMQMQEKQTEETQILLNNLAVMQHLENQAAEANRPIIQEISPSRADCYKYNEKNIDCTLH